MIAALSLSQIKIRIYALNCINLINAKETGILWGGQFSAFTKDNSYPTLIQGTRRKSAYKQHKTRGEKKKKPERKWKKRRGKEKK